MDKEKFDSEFETHLKGVKDARFKIRTTATLQALAHILISNNIATIDEVESIVDQYIEELKEELKEETKKQLNGGE